MGFHHTLFVRQSIEDVDELKKYMYSGAGNLRFAPSALPGAGKQGTYGSAFLNAARSYAPTAQGTNAGYAGPPLERCAFICDEVARPPPFPEQGVAGGMPTIAPPAPERGVVATSSHMNAQRSSGVPTSSAIYAEGARTCLNASRLSSAKPQTEGAYDRLRGPVPLFWAIYIAIHGYEEYAQIGRGYSNFELNEKQKIVATIQNSPTILKQTNQKMTKDKIKEIMSEVMSGKNMGLSTLPAFAAVYNKRIIVILKNTMRIDVSAEGAEDTIVIRKNNKGMFAPDLDANVGIIEHETHCFHQIDKPLRPVSTYKLEELVEIAGLLEVPYENKKKPELYLELVRACI
jgi:hypothetical protein